MKKLSVLGQKIQFRKEHKKNFQASTSGSWKNFTWRITTGVEKHNIEKTAFESLQSASFLSVLSWDTENLVSGLQQSLLLSAISLWP